MLKIKFNELKKFYDLRFKFYFFIFGFTLGLTLINSLRIVAVNLRPIADDYCQAQVGFLNFFENVSFWYTTWSGDLFSIVLVYFAIALPLAYFPPGLGSSFTLLLTFFVIAYTVYRSFFYSQGITKKVQVKIFFIVFIFSSVTWIGYWQLPTMNPLKSEADKELSTQFFNAIVHWQTVNVAYVIIPSILWLLYWKLIKLKFSKFNLIYVSIIGFIVGLSGYVVAISIISFVFFDNFLGNNFKRNLRDKLLIFFSFFLAALLALAISFFSPGAMNRKQDLSSNYDYGSIFSILYNSIFFWSKSIFLATSLFVILFGYLLSFLFKNSKTMDSNLLLLKNFSVSKLIFLSYLCFLFAKLSEIFAYPAFWHEISSRTFLFFALFGLGVYLNVKFDAIVRRGYFPIHFTVTGILLIVSIYTIGKFTDNVESRYEVWKVGPAPGVGGNPADREYEWINTCWENFKELKNGYY